MKTLWVLLFQYFRTANNGNEWSTYAFGFVRNMKTSGFKIIEAGIYFTGTCQMLKGLFTEYLVSSQSNRDGCHMWGWKYSLFRNN